MTVNRLVSSIWAALNTNIVQSQVGVLRGVEKQESKFSQVINSTSVSVCVVWLTDILEVTVHESIESCSKTSEGNKNENDCTEDICTFSVFAWKSFSTLSVE